MIYKSYPCYYPIEKNAEAYDSKSTYSVSIGSECLMDTLSVKTKCDETIDH